MAACIAVSFIIPSKKCPRGCHISGVLFERRKVDKKQTYTKTEACKLYSRVFWTFLPNVAKIDHYNFEVYRFKVCAFFSETVKFEFKHEALKQEGVVHVSLNELKRNCELIITNKQQSGWSIFITVCI